MGTMPEIGRSSGMLGRTKKSSDVLDDNVADEADVSHLLLLIIDSLNVFSVLDSPRKVRVHSNTVHTL